MINLVFDYDGTLHNSMKIYAPSFQKCCELMIADGETVREYSEDEIKSYIGMDAKSMWNRFRPCLTQKKKDRYSSFIGANMLELIQGGRAELYDGVPEMLSRLKDKYRLIFLSSCKRDYMQEHIKHFKLDKYFADFYCTEDFGFVPKYKVFDTVKGRYDGQYIIIGDRYSDIEIAVRNKIKSIGCLYGYGNTKELKYADIKVGSIEQLSKVLI